MVQPVKFDTTKTQPVTPGLITPSRVGPDKSALYKPDTIKFVQSMLSSATQASDTIEMNQVADKAYELADMYNQQSPSNIAFLQSEENRLTNERDMSVGPTRDAFDKQLSEVSRKLVNARAQGMTPYQWSRRANFELTNLVGTDPGKLARASQVMDEIFTITGAKSNSKIDGDILKAQSDAAIKRQETMVAKIEEYMPVYGMSEQEMLQTYNQIITVEGKTKEYELLVNNKNKLRLLDKDVFYDSIGGTKGLSEWRLVAYNSITTNLTNILASGEDLATKKAAGLKVLEDQENFLMEVYGQLPQNEGNKEAVSNFLTKSSDMIKLLREQFLKDITLDDFKAYKNNLKVIQESEDYQEFRQKYGNPQELDLAVKLMQAASSEIRLAGKTGISLDNIGKLVNQLTTGAYSGSDFKTSTRDILNSTNGSPLNSMVGLVNEDFDPTKQLNNVQYGILVNQLSATDAMTGMNRHVYFDKAMQTISNLKPELLEAALEDSNYNYLLTTKFNEYNQQNQMSFANLLKDLGMTEISDIVYSKERGAFAHQNMKINDHLKRINYMIKIAAKMQSINPNEIALNFIELEYPYLNVVNLPETK